MSTVPNNSSRKAAAPQSNEAPIKLDLPWRIHCYVWVFMVTFGLSPLLYVLGTCGEVKHADWVSVLLAVGVLQNLLWFAQWRCSTPDLTYWEGLLIAAASVETGSFTITLPMSFLMLLFTVAASFRFALLHVAKSPARNATLCFARLIIGIHRSRLWR